MVHTRHRIIMYGNGQIIVHQPHTKTIWYLTQKTQSICHQICKKKNIENQKINILKLFPCGIRENK